ncbi:MAG: gephyrin-like molybdotransferase Glp [Bacteroidota bacterium]
MTPDLPFPTMLNAGEALRQILDASLRLNAEVVPLGRSFGRTLASDVVSDRDIPPFANSSMDGYAVRRSDLEGATAGKPIRLPLQGESRAGKPFSRSLGPQSAIRVMTGAKVPDGADAVVPVEHTGPESDGSVTFQSCPPASANIRLVGEDIKKGELVMPRGKVITPSHAAVLASLGRASARVTKPPRVAIVPTGDEVVAPGRKLREGQIYNSSSIALAGMVTECGAQPRLLGIAGDTKTRVKEAIRGALKDDVVLVTGGVSVGRYDIVRDVLADLGVKIRFWQVNIKPGKPLVFGTKGKKLVFGLPGNPVSTGVTFLQFVRPALQKMLGRKDLRLSRLTAVADEPLRKTDGKRHFIRGIVRQEEGSFRVRTTGSQSSGVMSSLLKANCLIILPEEKVEVKVGEEVEVEMLPAGEWR